MSELPAGTLLRWRDQRPDRKPLGIVLAPPAGRGGDAAFVLMADHQANVDVEVFVARPEATGVDAASLVLESMELVDDADPALAGLLRRLGPSWWHIAAHLDGGHDEAGDPGCPVCGEIDDTR